MSKFQSIKSMGRQLRDIPDPAMRRRIETIMGNIEALGNSAEFLRDQAAASAGSGIITQIKWISTFGALPSNPDNSDAFGRAVDWLNDQDNPACLAFEAGIYSYSVSPNWALTNGVIKTCGVVRLRYTGTGNAFILDGGAGGLIVAMRIGRLFIEAPTTAGHGIYWRGVHHSKVDFNVRGCGATKAGLHMEFGVVNEFRLTVSANEPDPSTWYTNAKPKYGIYMKKDTTGGPPSWTTFINPILEGTEIGCEIESGLGTLFNGGTMEGCTDTGLVIGSTADGCLFNKVYGTDFEVNTNYDIDCDGFGNEFHNLDVADLVRFSANAEANKIVGGGYDNITLDSGSTGNLLSGVTINRFGAGGVYTNNGTNNKCEKVYNAGTGEWLNCQDYHVATSITDNIAAQTPVGTVADTQTALDGNEYNMPENNSNPALDIDFNFTGVTQIHGVVFNARYVGSASHQMLVSIWDYNSSVRRNLMVFSTTASDNYRTILIPDDTNFIDGSGNAQISFHHSLVPGNTSHDLYVDYIALMT